MSNLIESFQQGKFLEIIYQQKLFEVAKLKENPHTSHIISPDAPSNPSGESLGDNSTSQPRNTYSLQAYIKTHPEKLHVIAEVKRGSPSKGVINDSIDLVEQAKTYQSAGASAISVLRDREYFLAQDDDLKNIANEVRVPILNKDFIIDKVQIDEAFESGANVILLIVAMFNSNLGESPQDLNLEKLQELFSYTESLGLEVLLEVHNLEELKIAHQITDSTDSKMIGINNRNLKTFEVDLNNTLDLSPHFLKDRFYIMESGIKTPQDLTEISSKINGILIGETLMRSEDPKAEIESLTKTKASN